MNKFQRGAEVLEREINRLNDLTALADELKRIGSIEQAEGEAASKLTGINEKIKAAAAELKAAEAATAAARDEAQTITANAEAAAKAATDAATVSAEEIVVNAEGRAAKIAADSEARRKDIEARIANLRREENDATAAAATAQARLDEINAQLEGVRRKIA